MIGRGARTSAGRLVRRAIPVVALVGVGCFATREDMRVLQGDIQTMRQETLRADAARAAQLTTIANRLVQVSDSVEALGTRVTRMQALTREDAYNIQQYLIQIQELTGQSQRRILDLRAELEARNQAMPAEPVPPPTAGNRPGAPQPTAPRPAAGNRPGAPQPTPPRPATPAAQQQASSNTDNPGPAQLLQLSLDQLRRGSPSTARAGLEELLERYPRSDLVPQAVYYLGETYAAQGNMTTADSVFVRVYTDYPNASQEASTAMYKHGLYLEEQGNEAEARRIYRQVLQRYPRTDAAQLAQSRLPSR